MSIFDLCFKAGFFDLDGTLIDRSVPILKGVTWWATPHALDPGHVLRVLHGRRFIETVRMVAPDLDALFMVNIQEPCHAQEL
jgi:mannitol-1-/sugar-/sorbitol-6-phosphatase